MTHLKSLKSRLKTICCLREISELLTWDQETYMPEGAADVRADHLATVSEIAHQKFVCDEFGEELEKAQAEITDPDCADAHLLRKVSREYTRERQVPNELMAQWSAACGRCQSAWVKARAEGKFSLMQDEFTQVLDYARQLAQCYGYREHIYDAMLEGYEPGCTTSQLQKVFDELRPHLVNLVAAITSKGPADDSLLTKEYDIETQRIFTRRLSTDMGYDWKHGRTDDVIHPFCCSFSTRDVRITNVFKSHELTRALFGALHETGHALYELGCPQEWVHSPLEGGASMGWHECQSRLWENIIGRSLPFWEYYYPELQKLFPEQLGTAPLQDFYRAINIVKPSFVRTEADEVTYNLHIMLRFDLEKSLMEGSLDVRDIPEAWNEAMRDYLGIVPANDREGCAQDVHWPSGLIGYFPSYALGNIRSAQVWEALCRDIDGANALRQGNLSAIREWLHNKVYIWSARLLPDELMQKVTGQELRSQAFVEYLESKYKAIYG